MPLHWDGTVHAAEGPDVRRERTLTCGGRSGAADGAGVRIGTRWRVQGMVGAAGGRKAAAGGLAVLQPLGAGDVGVGSGGRRRRRGRRRAQGASHGAEGVLLLSTLGGVHRRGGRCLRLCLCRSRRAHQGATRATLASFAAWCVRALSEDRDSALACGLTLDAHARAVARVRRARARRARRRRRRPARSTGTRCAPRWCGRWRCGWTWTSRPSTVGSLLRRICSTCACASRNSSSRYYTSPPPLPALPLLLNRPGAKRAQHTAVRRHEPSPL